MLGTTTKSRLNTLISDIIKCSIDKDDIIMSDTVHKAMTDLRQFMFDKLYTNPAAKSEEIKVCKLITELIIIILLILRSFLTITNASYMKEARSQSVLYAII